MSGWTTVKSLKKEPYRETTNISCADHCSMDVLLEELSEMGDINALVVGVGECAYYSRKIPFAKGGKNWAYELSNEEIIFGDMSGIGEALARLSDSPYRSVCLFTCIPCLINLSFDELKQKFPKIAFLSAPDYKGISPYDILDELYVSLFGETESGKSDKISTWSWDEAYSVQDTGEKLLAKTHIVNNYHYMRLLESLAKRHSLGVINNSRFQPPSFYRTYASELSIREVDIDSLERLNEQILRIREPLTVKGPFAYDFAAYLHMLGADIRYVIMNGRAYNQYTNSLLRELPADTLLSFDMSEKADKNGSLLLDFSECQEALSQKQGLTRLLVMMHKSEELCH